MGRPAKSKELKALEGTLRKDRDRVPTKRKLENAELPQPQLDLEDEAIELFYALCTHLNEAGVLEGYMWFSSLPEHNDAPGDP